MRKSNAMPLLLVGAGALALLAMSSKADAKTPTKPDEDDDQGDDDISETDAERIVRESREIIQGKRDAYTDAPDKKVSDVEAARRVKEMREAQARKEAAEEKAAIEAARKAWEAEQARLLEEQKKPSKPDEPTKPAEPAKPTDTALTVLSVKTAQGWLNALGYGLKVDGLYGPRTTAAYKDAAAKRGLPTPFVKKTKTSATTNKITAEGLLEAARKAKATDAAKAEEQRKQDEASKGGTKPGPVGPQPPDGFDREKAGRAAPDVAKHLAQKGISHYSRPVLRTWQKLAGIAQDGIYGRGSAAALRYYVGAKAPKPFFAQGEDFYPWG
jgi:peptidoglycan hydrolase-like protein with peptidoglycan-binding domain